MEAQNVDHPALAVDGEGHLGGEGPIRKALDEPGKSFVEGRVSGVQHAVELATAPTRLEVNANLEGRCDAQHGVDGQRSYAAALDPRDGRDRDARPLGDIGLAPSMPNPHGPEDRAEGKRIHGWIIADRPLPAAYRP